MPLSGFSGGHSPRADTIDQASSIDRPGTLPRCHVVRPIQSAAASATPSTADSEGRRGPTPVRAAAWLSSPEPGNAANGGAARGLRVSCGARIAPHGVYAPELQNSRRRPGRGGGRPPALDFALLDLNRTKP